MPTPTTYAQQKLRQYNGNPIDLDTDTIKVALFTSSYSPNYTTNTTYSSISANEVSGTGYSAGGATITGSTVALDGSTVEWTHDDVTWAQNGAGFTNARYAVWYATGTGYLIMGMDLGGDKSIVTGALTLDVTASTGVLAIA